MPRTSLRSLFAAERELRTLGFDTSRGNVFLIGTRGDLVLRAVEWRNGVRVQVGTARNPERSAWCRTADELREWVAGLAPAASPMPAVPYFDGAQVFRLEAVA